MSRDWRLRVDDMVAAVNRSLAFTAGMSLDSFRADERTANAVLYDLLVIGEAAARLPEEVRRREPAVAWRELIGMRNVIVHGYFALDSEVVWKTARNDLPVLLEALQRLLA